jgi:hypothetical protein
MLAKRQKKEGQDGLDISLELGQARISLSLFHPFGIIYYAAASVHACAPADSQEQVAVDYAAVGGQ